MNKKFIIIVLSLLLLIGGCQKTNTKTDIPKQNTLEQIQQSKQKIDLNTEEINKSLEIINSENSAVKKYSGIIEQLLPEEAKNKVGPYISNLNKSSDIIGEESNKINKFNAELKNVSPVLEQSTVQIKQSDDVINKLKSERDKALEEKNKLIIDSTSQMQKMLRWLTIYSIIGASLCILLFIWLKNKLILFSAAGFLVVMTLTITISSFYKYIAIAGLIILIIFIISLIFAIWKYRKSIFELVETVEVTKDNLDEENKKKLFGEKKVETKVEETVSSNVGVIDKIQSDNTKKIVSDTKSKFSNLWNYAKEKKQNGLIK